VIFCNKKTLYFKRVIFFSSILQTTATIKTMKKLLLMTFLLTSIFAETIGMVKTTKGTVQIKRDNKIIDVSPGCKLEKGDILLTQKSSSMGVMFVDGTRLSLGEKSIVSINKYIFKPSKKNYNIDLNMTKGKASFSSGKIGKLAPKSVKFKVPSGVIGIRGTKFFVEVK